MKNISSKILLHTEDNRHKINLRTEHWVAVQDEHGTKILVGSNAKPDTDTKKELKSIYVAESPWDIVGLMKNEQEQATVADEGVEYDSCPIPILLKDQGIIEQGEIALNMFSDNFEIAPHKKDKEMSTIIYTFDHGVTGTFNVKSTRSEVFEMIKEEKEKLKQIIQPETKKIQYG